jgi:hypothetical protein
MRFLKRGLVGFVLFGIPAIPVAGAELEIAYSTLEKMIVERVMTEGGRHYMEGDPSNTCNYSFIQEPRVDAVGGRLRIIVLYAGRAGKEIGGNCVGPGDNFDLEITGVPSFENGEFYLKDLDIQAPDTRYFQLVAPLIRGDLQEEMRYPIRERLDYAAAWISSTTSSGKVSLESLEVDSIKVGDESITMTFDFGLSFKP